MDHASKGGSSHEGRLFGPGQFMPRGSSGPEYTARRERARKELDDELAKSGEARDWSCLRDALAVCCGCLHPVEDLKKMGDDAIRSLAC